MGSRKLKNSIILIAIVAVAGKLITYLVELLIAINFGASNTTDAFVMARALPLRIGNIVSWGLYAAFVPFYVRLLKEDKARAGVLSFYFSKNVFLYSLALSLLIAFGAEFIIRALAPGFNQETLGLAVNLLRIMSWSILLGNLAAIAQSVNSSRKHEFIASSSQPLNNMIILFSILVAMRFLGIYAVAVGFFLGALCKLLSQFLSFNPSKEFPSNLREKLPKGLMRKIWKSFFAIAGILLINECIMMAIRIFASHYEGAVSILNYGFVIAQAPLLIIETLIFYYFFPLFVEQSDMPDRIELRSNIQKFIRAILFVLIPLSLMMFLLSGLISRVLFLHGKFTWETVDKTAHAVALFSLSLIGLAIDALVFKVAIILGGIRKYSLIVILKLLLNLTLSVLFIKILDPIIALSLAYSLSSILTTCLLFRYLEQFLKFKFGVPFLKNIFKISGISLVSAGGVFIVRQIFVSNHLLAGFSSRLAALFIAVLVGSGLYLYLAYLMKLGELGLINKLKASEKGDK
ncbi:MAG: polysaccharide biosynthesis C-terminal domain-containing protein [Candidatus Omnitrophica bacterium]|nr:polysaccharide biosynthesis C-terminal domain-containing protein [Candidatus Omnitrophota bacterium]MBU1869062.1 polysaccharide biosynthesis C-terminal domain-containing protein [Candidatus Omnitrophota bacterium]